MSEQELSKKERKELKKQEQAEAAKRAEAEKRAKAVKKWTIVVIAIVVIVGFLAWLTSAAPEREFPTDDTPGVINDVSTADHSKGASADTAQAVLIEYGDLQCPACAQYSPIVSQLAEDFSDSVQIVYRHLPLQHIHPNATIAAQYAEAAGRQGMFFEMHDLMFERQPQWSRQTRGGAERIFREFGEELGLDIEQLETDAQDETIREKIEAERIDAIGAGANATPTFFLNGERIVPPGNYADFVALLQDTIGVSAQPSAQTDTGEPLNIIESTTEEVPTLDGLLEQ